MLLVHPETTNNKYENSTYVYPLIVPSAVTVPRTVYSTRCCSKYCLSTPQADGDNTCINTIR